MVKSVLFRGPAGSGKTSLAEHIAELWGAKCLYFLCHPWVTEEHLFKSVDLGKVALKDPAPYKNGVLSEAAEISHSGKVVVVIDELDKTKEFVDNLLLDFIQNGRVEGKDGVVRANPDNIILFITSNDHRELSDPLLRRVAKFYVDFLPNEVEIDILMGNITGYWMGGKRDYVARYATSALEPVRDVKLVRVIQTLAKRMRGKELDISTSELSEFLRACSEVKSAQEMSYAIEAWLEKTPEHGEFIRKHYQGRNALAGVLYALIK